MTKHHGRDSYGNRWPSFIACVLLSMSLEQFAARWAAADGNDFVAQSQKQWHQWRGPLATGVAPFGNPPVEWSETKHVKWKVEAPGRGGSTPIVWNGKIYLATAVNSGRVIETAAKPEDQPERPFGIKYPNTVYQYQLLCFDLASGEKLWERTACEELPHEGHHGDNTFASSSPYVDGQSVYVSFGSRGLYCYSLDGDLRWKHPLPNVKTRLSFGEASSPVVARGRLVLVRDNEESSRILVLDAATGELKWQADREEVSAWATPLVTEYQGRWQVVTNASARVRSYDLETGELIWECGGQVANVIPSPMRHGDNVICMSGYKGSAAFSLPLDARGNITDTDKIGWRYDRDTPYVPSALLFDNRLYFPKLNTAIFTMLDATTGQPIVAASRLQGVANVYASPVAAAGRVYIVGRDGSAVVLKQGDELQTLATNKLDDGIDASPAIVGNSLLLRGHKYLYHIAE